MVAIELSIYMIKELGDIAERRKDFMKWLEKCPIEIYQINWSTLNMDGTKKDIDELMSAKTVK